MPALQPARNLVWILQGFLCFSSGKDTCHSSSRRILRSIDSRHVFAAYALLGISHISRHHGAPLEGANVKVAEGVNCSFVKELIQMIHYIKGSCIMNSVIEITAKSEKVTFREESSLNCLNTSSTGSVIWDKKILSAMLTSVLKCKSEATLLYLNQHRQGQTLSPDSCNSVSGSWHCSTRTQMWSLLQLHFAQAWSVPGSAKQNNFNYCVPHPFVNLFFSQETWPLAQSWPPVKCWIDSP